MARPAGTAEINRGVIFARRWGVTIQCRLTDQPVGFSTHTRLALDEGAVDRGELYLDAPDLAQRVGQFLQRDVRLGFHTLDQKVHMCRQFARCSRCTSLRLGRKVAIAPLSCRKAHRRAGRNTEHTCSCTRRVAFFHVADDPLAKIQRIGFSLDPPPNMVNHTSSTLQSPRFNSNAKRLRGRPIVRGHKPTQFQTVFVTLLRPGGWSGLRPNCSESASTRP